jgi:predicted O-methyltransferase YrrM
MPPANDLLKIAGKSPSDYPPSNMQPTPFCKYDLSHLQQFDDQFVIGPIQDDEALFLYATIRGIRIKTVLELGGLDGYSARNFLKAVGSDGRVFTCDIHPVAQQAPNHHVIIKDCTQLTPDDLLGAQPGLIFFDCHEYDAQIACFHRLLEHNLITDSTVLALHDTHLHPEKYVDWAYPTEGGFVHQAVERRMVMYFAELGYHAFMLHTHPSAHSPTFPFRHGVTLMQKWSPLVR